jgi:hypothetical protein
MKTQRLTRVMLAGAVALALTALTVLLIALPATAGPTAQDGWTPIPTPTVYPVTDLSYVLSTVGGDPAPQTFSGQEVDGVTFGDTIIESSPPRTMDFETSVDSGTEINQVSLIIRFANGATISPLTMRDDEQKVWKTHWNISSNYWMVTWTPLNFRWCAEDAAGEQVCSDYQAVDFWDPVQKWNRVENDYAVLYWYGFGEDQREDIAVQFTEAITATHHRLLAGSGHEMSYKPVVVLFPDQDSLRRFFPNMPITAFAGVMALTGQSFHPLVINIDTCPYLLHRSNSHWSGNWTLRLALTCFGDMPRFTSATC